MMGELLEGETGLAGGGSLDWESRVRVIVLLRLELSERAWERIPGTRGPPSVRAIQCHGCRF